jgi:hypothetical protein
VRAYVSHFLERMQESAVTLADDAARFTDRAMVLADLGVPWPGGGSSLAMVAQEVK